MFKDIEITLDGKTYRIKPTMDLIRKLELAGVGPFEMTSLLHRGSPSFALFASFLAVLILHAGGTVTDQDLYESLREQGRANELHGLCVLAVSALIPQREAAPGSGATGAKKQTARRTRTT